PWHCSCRTVSASQHAPYLNEQCLIIWVAGEARARHSAVQLDFGIKELARLMKNVVESRRDEIPFGKRYFSKNFWLGMDGGQVAWRHPWVVQNLPGAASL
ncbi:MAG: hypothetical protein ABSB74_07620, partial [Tepidisphaeraceae bacterium]